MVGRVSSSSFERGNKMKSGEKGAEEVPVEVANVAVATICNS